MCGETRVRVGFGPLLQGPRNSPLLPPHIQPLGHRLDFGGFVQIKSLPQLQLNVLRLCSTTRQRRHRTPPSLIKLSSFIRNIQIAISVSCLFFVCSQEIDPRGQVGRAPAWSITPRKLVQRLLRRDVFARSQSDRQSRLPQKTIAISSKHRDTFAPIKWYQIARLLGEILQFFEVQIESILHTYSPRKSQKNLGLVHLIRTNLSLCIIFSVFAFLNLLLHRRVKLLVLASSTLEFRVLFTSCHAAAAPSSSPLPYTTIIITITI